MVLIVWKLVQILRGVTIISGMVGEDNTGEIKVLMSSRRMFSINKEHSITQLLLSFVSMNQTSLERGGKGLRSTRKYHTMWSQNISGK